jgi:hypothetical protein
MIAPDGITNSKEVSVPNPKPWMMVGIKVEIGPFAHMVKNVMHKTSQNFKSMSSS